MDKKTTSQDRSLGQSKGDGASTGSAAGNRSLADIRSLSLSKGDGASTGSAADNRSLADIRSLSLSKGDCHNLSKGNSNRKILIWILTGSFILFIVVIIILADRGILPAPIGMMYNYAWGDKLGHFILMGLLTFLVNLSCSARRIQLFSKSILLGSLFVSIAVVLEEVSQLFFAFTQFFMAGFDE